MLAGLTAALLLLGVSLAEEQCDDQASLLAVSRGAQRGLLGLDANRTAREYCGNTGIQCQSCQVCVGGMKSYACAGPCANNEACGSSSSPCPTCADRVKTLVDNGMGVQAAMDSIGQNYGWSEPGCACLKSPPEDCYCGNTGKQCTSDQVCVGSMKTYACAGSCANSQACLPGDTPGSCPTCADRVKVYTDSYMGVQDAMNMASCSFSECACMGDRCGNTGQQCCNGEVCVGGMKSYACAGSCANNDACGAGDTHGSCPTCADRVQTLVENGMGVTDAMNEVGKNYGWDDPGCNCMKSS